MGEVKQYEYISVYKSDETDFRHNGLRILCPTSCTITETLNGEYSLELTHSFDEWGNWKYLVEYNIIKAQGQLFRIYRKNTSMASDGTKQRTVSALHIFYDLNFYFIQSTRPIGKNGPDALDWIMEHTYIKRGSGSADAQSPTAEFTFSSDLKGNTTAENVPFLHTAYYEDMSVTKALMGADNCFLNVWGGELIRDNFKIAINKRRGADNAFNIRYGVDMIEIEEEVDFSDYCGAVYWEGVYKYNVTLYEKEELYLKPVITNGAIVIGDKKTESSAELEVGDIGLTVETVTAAAGDKNVSVKIYADTKGYTMEILKFKLEYDSKLTLQSATKGGGLSPGTFSFDLSTNVYTLTADADSPAKNDSSSPILKLEFNVASDAKGKLPIKITPSAGYSKVKALRKTNYLPKQQEMESPYRGIASLNRVDLPELPVVPMKYLKLEFNEDEKSSDESVADHFDKLARDYMLTNCSPIVNYRVTFANLKDFDIYKDFIGLQNCELGDIGTIYNEELGIQTTQQIVKRTIDGITGEVTSIELGSLRKSFTSSGRVNGGYDSARAELLKNEISYNNTWENLGEEGLSLADLNTSWSELAGDVVESEVE